MKQAGPDHRSADPIASARIMRGDLLARSMNWQLVSYTASGRPAYYSMP